jgi:hypothetical protein
MLRLISGVCFSKIYRYRKESKTYIFFIEVISKTDMH